MSLELPAGVPQWVLIAGAVALVVLAALGWRALAVAARHRRERRQALATAGPEAQQAAQLAAKDRRARHLVNAAAAICIVLYLGLFASAFQAIAGFARDYLGRTGVMVPATPLTLDGVVIGALFLSLAFVAKRKSPAKANALIWGMTIFAAFCGFTYGESGDHGSLAAGLYYAVMSLVGMVMFHMVLELFQDGDGDYIKSKYPSMGWRWLTHWSTLPVMLAWINHPPRRRDESVRPSVREAIDHWQHVKTVRARAASVRASIEHDRKLAAARRTAELATARQIAKQPPAPAAAPVAPAPVPAQPLPVPSLPAQPLPSLATEHFGASGYGHGPATGQVNGQVNGHGYPPAEHSRPTVMPAAAPGRGVTIQVDTTGSDVALPASPSGTAQWLANWVTVCQEAPEVALQQVREPSDDECKAKFGFSYKQLQKVRKAARTGALRRRAAEHNVELPDGYVDQPINGSVPQPVG